MLTSTPSRYAAIRPSSSTSPSVQALDRWHPVSSSRPNIAPTDELNIAGLDGMKQGLEQFEQGLKDLQDSQEEDVQRLRANDETLEGKLMALESQMNELRAEVERLHNGSHIPQRSDSSKLMDLEQAFQKMECSPAMGLGENFASTREEPSELFEANHETNDSTAKLILELQSSRGVVQELSTRLSESQSEQVKQGAKIRLLEKRKTTYLELLRREISPSETLLTVFREVQEKGCLKADDIHKVAAWLECEDGPRSDGLASSSIGCLPTIKDEEMNLALGGGQKNSSEQRIQEPSLLVVEIGRTSSDSHRVRESTDITTESLGSLATSGSLPSNKRKRSRSEAGDEQGNSAIAPQRRRLDLEGSSVATPQGPRANTITSAFSRDHPPRELASNWCTPAPGPRELERPISHFDFHEPMPPLRAESKYVEEEEGLVKKFQSESSSAVRIPAQSQEQGFLNWKSSVLRYDR